MEIERTQIHFFKRRFRGCRRRGILNSLLKGAGHKNIAVLGYFCARVMT